MCVCVWRCCRSETTTWSHGGGSKEDAGGAGCQGVCFYRETETGAVKMKLKCNFDIPWTCCFHHWNSFQFLSLFCAVVLCYPPTAASICLCLDSCSICSHRGVFFFMTASGGEKEAENWDLGERSTRKKLQRICQTFSGQFLLDSSEDLTWKLKTLGFPWFCCNRGHCLFCVFFPLLYV